MRVVVIGARPVDFGDTQRFACLWHEQRRCAWLSKIQVFDASSGELSESFAPV